MKSYLTSQMRDDIMQAMSVDQKLYLQEEMKRGKRTIFANHLAADKGAMIEPDMTLDEVEDLLSEWTLIDYLDGGLHYRSLDPTLRCECGKVLRYQYIILHKLTGEVRKFGITHFEEHTGFPPHVINEIRKGFERIDYELDEILIKYTEDWSITFDLPETFELPIEIKRALDLGLPLLDRQIKKLQAMFIAYTNSFAYKKVKSVRKPLKANQTVDDHMGQSGRQVSQIDANFKEAIKSYLMPGTVSATELSEKMTFEKGYPNYYKNGKLEVYSNILNYLESLCSRGQCRRISKRDHDVVYKIL